MEHFSPDKYTQSNQQAQSAFMLDLAASLESVARQFVELQGRGRPYQTAQARITLLRYTLAQLREPFACSPEAYAALQRELAVAYQDDIGIGRGQHMEAALLACETALEVYTLAHYPYQHASLQITLSSIYRERITQAQRDNLERAIACCREALQYFTLEAFPYEYAQAQQELGQVYQIRIEGKRPENIELSIGCCQQALSVYTEQNWPVEHAKTLHILGTAYIRRLTGDRRDNLEQAIAYYQQAAAIFAPETFPMEYGKTQNNLAAAYSQRISGEQRDNIEQAIACYRRALRVCTLQTFPTEYANYQNNLGIAYWQRVMGERRDNLEQAITCYREGLRVHTLEDFPYQYAMLHNNLGALYVVRMRGTRRENLEQAIACYQEVLCVWTLENFPYQYAKLQNNLGEAYQHRLSGEKHANLKQAIACYQEALRIWTLHASPLDYAMTQRNLGMTYQLLVADNREENLSLAVASHQEALAVYTLEAFPSEHRQVQLECAETQALRRDWQAAHDAYASARQAEDLLVALGAGVVGRDAILKEGRDAAVRDGFVLAQLGRIEEAALAIEGGRARGLSEAIQFNAAAPDHISDPERRERYTTTRQAFIAAQTALQAPPPPGLDEDSQRQVMLERTANYRTTKAAFDAAVEAIRVAQDPADFLHATLDATTLQNAAEHCGQGHALVYLAATPWGGVAIGVFAANPAMQTGPRVAALALPSLTDTFVNALVETRAGADGDDVMGGFDCAQRGNAFELLQSWPGTTFREQAEALHAACIAQKHAATLDQATQYMLAIPQLGSLIDTPVSALSDEGRSLIAGTLNHAVLQRELQRCQPLLREAMLQPVVAWLREAGTSSLTLIPCGPLAAFPLTCIPLNDGYTLNETLPTSVAPSARSLLPDRHAAVTRTGIYALGNPYPTQQALRWGEAEAFTIARLGDQLRRPSGVKVQWQATRNWLIEVLQTGHVVDASCHGEFDTRNFLSSKLVLAHEEALTLADMLSYQVDLRGLRLLILSSCQTAMLDLQGARDEVRSLAVGMLQAGATAVLAALWSVDDRATYLLMVRFALEWFPRLDSEPPAPALARAQHWLRTVTNRELQAWSTTPSSLSLPANGPTKESAWHDLSPLNATQLVAVRGRSYRFDTVQAQEIIQSSAEEQDPDARPYADPYYWAGFQITGW
ncbi:MAG TPA: CHAT domain-containing tetratricopeptide repeat protein [Ktedonobacteraceae bacterium]|nr:CHAT domain-containing tetratricopeptide repeat protein [Ktedonobacteraceae bacterium]